MKRYWFVRKTYGYGWTPATWQGWLVLFLYILCLSIAATFFPPNQNPIFPFIMIIATVLLIAISFFTGESPRWQWGRPKS